MVPSPSPGFAWRTPVTVPASITPATCWPAPPWASAQDCWSS